MVTVLPPTVTRVLGVEASNEFTEWLDDVLRERAVPRDECRTVLSRLDLLEHDLDDVKVRLDSFEARVDARFDVVDMRFDAMQRGMDTRFDAMQRGMDARFDAMNGRFDAMQRDMNARFDAVNGRFDAVQDGMNARFDAVQDGMNARIDTIHDVIGSQTRWLIATLVAIGGLISALLTVFKFLSP